MSTRGGWRGGLAVAALCVAWWVLSAACSVVWKQALVAGARPLAVCGAQLAGAAAVGATALWAAGVPPAPHYPRALYVRALLPLAAAKLLATLLSQLSLWKVPVSYTHTVKATTPLWTALVSWALWGERVSWGVCGALALVALGVGVASATELQFDAGGLGAALAAAAVLALQHAGSKRLLAAARAHHLRVLQTLTQLALLLFLPALLRELWLWRGDAALAARLAGGGALAWLQAAAAFSVLRRVSPLTYAVASAAKRAAVVLASLLLLRNPAPPANVAGMALAAAGVLLYDRARARDRQRTPPLLPV